MEFRIKMKYVRFCIVVDCSQFIVMGPPDSIEIIVRFINNSLLNYIAHVYKRVKNASVLLLRKVKL